MLSRPTTEQILLDCCRELMTAVLPALTDETAQVSVIMVETVLRNAAVRAAHEVAWMREETAEIESYAQAVAGQAPAGTSPGADTAIAAAWRPWPAPPSPRTGPISSTWRGACCSTNRSTAP